MIIGLLVLAAIVAAFAAGQVSTATNARIAYEAGRLERSEEHAQLRQVWQESAARERRLLALRTADATAHARQLAAISAEVVRIAADPTLPQRPEMLVERVLPKAKMRRADDPPPQHLPDRELELLAERDRENQ